MRLAAGSKGESKKAAREDVGEHHWTEKLADPFLGLTLFFYYAVPTRRTTSPRTVSSASKCTTLPVRSTSSAREIACLHREDAPVEPGAAILSRRVMRLRSPLAALRDLYTKLRRRRLHLPGAIRGKA